MFHDVVAENDDTDAKQRLIRRKTTNSSASSSLNHTHGIPSALHT